MVIEVYDIDSPEYWLAIHEFAWDMYLEIGPRESTFYQLVFYRQEIRRRKSALARKTVQPYMPCPWDNDVWEVAAYFIPCWKHHKVWLRMKKIWDSSLGIPPADLT